MRESGIEAILRHREFERITAVKLEELSMRGQVIVNKLLLAYMRYYICSEIQKCDRENK